MQDGEAVAAFLAAIPRFEGAGLPAVDPSTVKDVHCRSIARLWAGMGHVYELTAAGVTIIAKRVQLPASCGGIGDERKRASYHVEASFYANGIASQLAAAGCALPLPLHVSREPTIFITMTQLEGRRGGLDAAETRAALEWLARLHATFWGHTRADAAVGIGLQPQGTYWYLDTRPDELESMPTRGWEGRLRLAAGAIDARLKAERYQTIVHGDAKDANMLFSAGGGGGGEGVRVAMYDFQYCGKASPAKDLAYLLTCASSGGLSEDGEALRYYLDRLAQALPQGETPPAFADMYDALILSYADLGRWMSGWGWWGHDLRGKIEPLLDRLDGGKPLASEEAYSVAMQREYPCAGRECKYKDGRS